MLKFISLLAGASIALAQQYSISTVAGGAPPATPAAAASISMGQPGRVALDASGNLYFSASNSVFKIDAHGTVTLIAGNSRAGFSGDGGPAVNAQLNAPQGIAFDPNGNIYIADSRNNRIRQVSQGIITTFAGTGAISPGGGPSAYGDGGPATNAQLHLPMGVAVDANFNVYIADTGDNTIREVTTDGNIATIAGDSFPSYQGDGGLAITAELHGPEDVAVDSSGNIYIADTQNAYIRKVTTDGNINYIAGDGSIGYTGDGGYATSAGLVAPFALAVDSSGNVYFAENGDSRIRRIDAKSLDISTVAGNGTPGFSGDGSTAVNAELNSPTGVAVDSAGNLYIADSLNCRIRKVASGNVSTFAGNGTFSYSGDGGPAIQAQLNNPQGVAVDASFNVYIADTLNNVVRKISANGTISNFAGNGGAGGSGDGSAATSAQLHGPQGLAVDAAGNLFIADTLNAKVRKVSAASGVITTVAGSGTPGYGGDGSAATSAQLNLPIGVAVDAGGNVYIADFGNSRVRKVSASGATIGTVAGNGSTGYSGDGGPAAKAQLNGPQGVAVDAAGNLYIADTENNAIREVTPAGLIATVAGNGLAGYSGDGGQATSAQVGNPVGVAVDAAGDIFTVDASNRVRQVYPNGLIATIAGDGSPGYTGDGGLATQAQLNAPSAIALFGNGLQPMGAVYMADTANNAVRLLQYAGNGLGVNAVANGASFILGAVAPGEVVVIWGSGLGPAQLTQYQLNPASGLVGTSLAGTSVIFGGTPAPVLYTSATQIGAVVPYTVAGSNVQVFVQYQGRSSAPVTVAVAAVAPALFTADSSGKGQAAASNQDGTLNGAAHPAKVGSYISLWLTGAGQMNPAGVDGQPGAAPLPQPAAAVAVTIGGQSVTPQYAGQAPYAVAGVMQINAQIPSGTQPGNAVPVVVQVGGVSTQAGVTVGVGN
jgi:uncharacterized protein (TIGR03437 family)